MSKALSTHHPWPSLVARMVFSVRLLSQSIWPFVEAGIKMRPLVGGVGEGLAKRTFGRDAPLV